VLPQSDSKDQFYRAVYCSTLNSNCVAKRVPKILKNKIVEDRSQKNAWVI
jgi:hypothetical protein